MGQLATAAVPFVDRDSLLKLETHFVAHEIYRRDDLAERQAKLARIVSTEIVPRLLRLHGAVLLEAPPVAEVIEALAPSIADVSGLADIVIGSDLEAAVAYVIVLRERGLAMETLFVELLEPTARHLGILWDRDECDFIDVTLGVARLQKLLAIFNLTHDLPALDGRRNVLMAVTPGDQHYFGVTMVAKFLAAAGWQVRTELSATEDEIADAAKSEWFAVVGLTIGSELRVENLRSTISKLRARSCNAEISVMVGGPIFSERPALVEAVGADATASNAPTAVLVTQKLFDMAALRGRASADAKGEVRNL